MDGCDSILSLNVTIYPASKYFSTITSCKSYTWPVTGIEYTKSGRYRDTLVSYFGCDSILELELNIVVATIQMNSVKACDEYTWPVNGNTYQQSGIYRDTFLNENGCDSIWILDLAIQNSVKIEENVTICESYQWPVNDRMYYQSGNFIEVFKNSAGCDSIRILHLKILQPGHDTLRVGVCNAYICPHNEKRITTSGIYTDTILNHLGCDSIITIDLTIFEDYKQIDTQRHCSEYYWAPANKIISKSGDYELHLNSRNGCDSLLQLHLQIDPIFYTTDTIYVFGSYYWSVTQKIYQQEGIYEWKLQTDRGCDSIHVLVLKILKRGDVFIPNVFTPNGDGVNDRFMVFATPEIKEIQRLRIYDRWGQMVFEQLKFSPNELAYGWDGTVRGQKSNPSVFVCTVEWYDAAGEYHLLTGDVTLIR